MSRIVDFYRTVCALEATEDGECIIFGFCACVSSKYECISSPYARYLYLLSFPCIFFYSRRNDLAFYSPAGHRAAFALPPVALSELAKPRPLLSDTSADLESIMAYGEESEDKIDDGWEPDVSGGGLRRRARAQFGVSCCDELQ